MPRFRVYTIGHGGRTVGGIVRQVRAKGIQFVIDVRSVPYSKYQPEFARKPLTKALRDAGLKYGFMGHQLGGRPDDEFCYDNNRVNYEKVHSLPLSSGRLLSESASSQPHRCWEYRYGQSYSTSVRPYQRSEVRAIHAILKRVTCPFSALYHNGNKGM